MKKSFFWALMAIVLMGASSCKKDDPKNEKGEVVNAFDDMAWFTTACCDWDSSNNITGIRVGAPSGEYTYLEAEDIRDAEEKVLDLLPPGKKFENGKITLLNMEGRVQGTLELKHTSGEKNAFATLEIDDHTGKCPLKGILFMEKSFQTVSSPLVPGDVVLLSWHGKGDAPIYPGYTPPCRETREVVDTLFYDNEYTYRYWESHVYLDDGTKIERDPNKGPLFWVCIKAATATERGILVHIMHKGQAETDNNGYATTPMAKRVGAIYRSNRALYTQYLIQVENLGTRKLGDGTVVLDREEVWTSQFNHGIFFPDFFSYHLDSDEVEKYAWSHPDLCKLRVYEFDIKGNLYPDMRNL